MIFIKRKNPPEAWCQKAEELTERLKILETPDERKRFIEDNKKLWKELKEDFLKMSNHKCWYSEAREIVSDYHVDHFRPKFRAKQLDGTERDGYWWLAFDWKNYRVCGSICNSPHCDSTGETRGKADYFPIKEGCSPATGPDSDLEDETIYLLDPTDPDDPLLLTFDDSGYPKPAADEGTWGFSRAKVTIKLLHLDYPLLVDERKKIWKKCNILTNEAQNLMSRDSVTSRTRLKRIFQDLREMVSQSSELSATAKACLLSSGNKWVQSLVSS